MRNFSLTDGNATQRRGKSLGDSWSVWNFLTQVVSDSAGEGALLDPLFLNKKGLVSDVMLGNCPGYSNQKMIRAVAKQLPWAAREETLTCLGDWLGESLARQY